MGYKGLNATGKRVYAKSVSRVRISVTPLKFESRKQKCLRDFLP